jgi:hypothetical protein
MKRGPDATPVYDLRESRYADSVLALHLLHKVRQASALDRRSCTQRHAMSIKKFTDAPNSDLHLFGSRFCAHR